MLVARRAGNRRRWAEPRRPIVAGTVSGGQHRAEGLQVHRARGHIARMAARTTSMYACVHTDVTGTSNERILMAEKKSFCLFSVGVTYKKTVAGGTKQV